MTGPSSTRRAGSPEQGRGDDRPRSDLRAVFEPGSSGGLDVAIDSKVAPYYGESIRAQALSVLGRLGVEHGRLALHDGGALPFVITARIEAAVRGAGLFKGPSPFGARKGDGPPPSPRDRLRRSRLYVPGNEPRFMINAGLHGPDGIILDLEDSVAPAHKDRARVLVHHALLEVDFGAAERMVRINQLPLGLADLELVIPARPDLVLIPKVESPEQVAEVDRAVADIQGRLGHARSTWLMPILESALGIENAHAIARSSDRVVAVTVGLEDLTADLGVPKTAEGHETLYSRARLVIAARAAGCQAIDSVFGDVGDMEGLRAWAVRSRALGFEGMGCIHPRQIPVIHDAFRPTEAEIEKALAIVAAYDDAQARGLGVTTLGSKMIDPPVVNRALKLVERARAMGLSVRGPAKEEP